MDGLHALHAPSPGKIHPLPGQEEMKNKEMIASKIAKYPLIMCVHIYLHTLGKLLSSFRMWSRPIGLLVRRSRHCWLSLNSTVSKLISSFAYSSFGFGAYILSTCRRTKDNLHLPTCSSLKMCWLK